MNKFRILIADDNQLIRTLLVRLLEDSGSLEVVGEAADGCAAVEMTRQLLPDAVLMDVNMPKMDGVEASRTIHALCPGVQVIGLSMFEKSDMGDRMLDAGAVTYFSKSDPLNQIIAGIHQVLSTENAASLIA